MHGTLLLRFAPLHVDFLQAWQRGRVSAAPDERFGDPALVGEEDVAGEADPWNTGARRPQRHALWVFGCVDIRNIRVSYALSRPDRIARDSDVAAM